MPCHARRSAQRWKRLLRIRHEMAMMRAMARLFLAYHTRAATAQRPSIYLLFYAIITRDGRRTYYALTTAQPQVYRSSTMRDEHRDAKGFEQHHRVEYF